ncbi:magnesium chelatase subunit [Hibiscus syriacus]|uniref:Magnesium chelatase subunit n=1 Tax=Hibiscus syriacus TaxID=106335 RepID=A0A6A2YGQ7_HIBSY|nr:magnesium chelatase subunit [Hibiscus syriacus]
MSNRNITFRENKLKLCTGYLAGIWRLGLISSLWLHWIQLKYSARTIGFQTGRLFACKGENKTLLPDVKKPSVIYSFRGQESWQPVTELDAKKCKRCGFYENYVIKLDYVYEEWEFCASDFKAPLGKYILFKKHQLNATFHCQECATLPGASNATPQNINDQDDDDDDGKAMRVFIIILITLLVLTVTIIALVVAHKHWQKKKRQQEQARFLKLFEEGDDIEDELGLGTVI